MFTDREISDKESVHRLEVIWWRECSQKGIYLIKGVFTDRDLSDKGSVHR